MTGGLDDIFGLGLGVTTCHFPAGVGVHGNGLVLEEHGGRGEEGGVVDMSSLLWLVLETRVSSSPSHEYTDE